jgi:hypothetical protein
LKREFIVEREGRSFVLYAGLLDEAHQQGLKSIATQLVQVPSEDNGNTAICTAVVETERGRFSGIGDACPDNVTRIMRAHLIRMSETRAKARALRDAVNIGTVAIEELGEDIGADPAGGSQPSYDPWAGDRVTAERTPTRSSAPTNGAAAARQQARNTGQGGDRATEAQVRALYAIGKRSFQMDEAAVNAECRRAYGKAPADLTKREASEFIDKLKTGAVPA